MKQVIIIRKDLNMRKGKMCAQAAHASLGAVENMSLVDRQIYNHWKHGGSTKICVGIDSEKELLELNRKAVNANLPTYLVLDAGRTEFNEPTITSLAIGPGKEEEIDKITKDLKLL